MNDSFYEVYIKRVIKNPRQYFAYKSIQTFSESVDYNRVFLSKERPQYIR